MCKSKSYTQPKNNTYTDTLSDKTSRVLTNEEIYQLPPHSEIRESMHPSSLPGESPQSSQHSSPHLSPQSSPYQFPEIPLKEGISDTYSSSYPPMSDSVNLSMDNFNRLLPNTTPQSDSLCSSSRQDNKSTISMGTSCTEINVILANLKLLSNVPQGAKLALRNNSIIIHDKNSWCDMAIRMYNGDSREHVTHYLDEFVKNLDIVMKNPNIDNPTKLRIFDGIVQSQNGMMHVKNTYYSDVPTRTKIETIIENMSQLLSESNNVYQPWILSSIRAIPGHPASTTGFYSYSQPSQKPNPLTPPTPELAIPSNSIQIPMSHSRPIPILHPNNTLQ